MDTAAKSRQPGGIESFKGRLLYPLRPKASDVDIEDIAHALGNKCRFTGHCREFYSVAQHSVIVSEFVERDLALIGLLHDASEYILPDIATPIKPLIRGFKEIEEGVLDVIFKRFGILKARYDEDIQAAIKRADRAVMACEVRDLMPGNPDYWQLPEPDPFMEIIPWSPKDSKRRFMSRYRQILDTMPELLDAAGMA